MARVTYIDLIDDYRGKLNTPKAKDGVIIVFRQKCYGVKPGGEPRLGPRESFAMHRHEGAWSANVQASRAQFGSLLKQAHAELRDPERKAYWQGRLDAYHANKKLTEKEYKRLFTFVLAQLRAGE